MWQSPNQLSHKLPILKYKAKLDYLLSMPHTRALGCATGRLRQAAHVRSAREPHVRINCTRIWSRAAVRQISVVFDIFRLVHPWALVSCTGRASARSPWAGPGQVSIIVCGPGRVRAWKLQARAGPGLVSNTFAGCGPGLGLTFPGLGRARAYSESHYYFNIMVKDYFHLSIAIRSLFYMLYI